MQGDDMKSTDLLAIGFARCGCWTIKQEALSILKAKDNGELFDHKHALYAFVERDDRRKADKVIYVGKTTRSAHSRFLGYASPGEAQQTNVKVHDAIVKALAEGHAVDIYLFVSLGQLSWCGVDINLAAGLEDALIVKARTSLNKIGNQAKTETEETEETAIEDEAYINAENEFTFLLTAMRLKYGTIPMPEGSMPDIVEGTRLEVSVRGGDMALAYKVTYTGTNRQRRFGTAALGKLLARNFTEGDEIHAVLREGNKLELMTG